jgi:hypothetical protein
MTKDLDGDRRVETNSEGVLSGRTLDMPVRLFGIGGKPVQQVVDLSATDSR